jgi:hypothetical protein
MGDVFVGRCRLCGKEGLRPADVLSTDCENPAGVSEDGALLRALEPDDKITFEATITWETDWMYDTRDGVLAAFLNRKLEELRQQVFDAVLPHMVEQYALHPPPRGDGDDEQEG